LFNFIKKGDIIELTDILSKIENPNILVQLSIQVSSNIPKEPNRISYMQLIYFALTSRLESELFDSITYLTNLPSYFFQMFELEANPNTYDEFGRTALGRACIDSNLFPTVVELLKCENIDINLLSKDKEIYAPIHIAAYQNNIRAVQTLLEIKDSNGKYRVNINIKNACGSTPIFIVSEKGDSCDLLELLLQHGADVNIQEHEYGYALIHIASQNGNLKILGTLLGDSMCNFELFDFNGNTALSIATIFNREDCVEFLLQKRANKFCVNKWRNTLLYAAALEGSIKSMNKLFPSLSKIVDIPNNIGLTPLHIATIRGNTLCTKLLIENGAKVNSRTKNGQTPLHCAATNNNIQDTILLLLTNGAIINARTNDGFIYKNTNVGGYTALHYAAYKGHLKVIQELIKHGADVYAKTTLGKNVFDIA
jgi:ankyrin